MPIAVPARPRRIPLWGVLFPKLSMRLPRCSKVCLVQLLQGSVGPSDRGFASKTPFNFYLCFPAIRMDLEPEGHNRPRSRFIRIAVLRLPVSVEVSDLLAA